MRTRAFRPEAPRCLEDRSLLSGLAGLSAHPVVLPQRRLGLALEHIQMGFQLAIRDREVNHLRDEINEVVVWMPFGRIDGLGVEINQILDRMQRDRPPGGLDAIRTAYKDVIAAVRAQVEARVQAGDVVIT